MASSSGRGSTNAGSSRRASNGSSARSSERGESEGEESSSVAGDEESSMYKQLKGVKPLDGEETKNFKLDMSRTAVSRQLPDILDDLSAKHGLIEDVLTLSKAERKTI